LEQVTGVTTGMNREEEKRTMEIEDEVIPQLTHLHQFLEDIPVAVFLTLFSRILDAQSCMKSCSSGFLAMN
jgi:hypothetical protein